MGSGVRLHGTNPEPLTSALCQKQTFRPKLNREINAGLADPKIKTRLEDLGGLPMPMTSIEFGQLIADETKRWASVIRSAGIKPD
jgi:tripartite-type tricarboxylate transporter receptor subunit TctC